MVDKVWSNYSFILYFCRELNKNGITENLQNSLKFYTCDLCNSFYSLHKVETGDCHQFFKTKKTTYEWKNMYFQILYGLYVFQKYLDGVHFDLYPRNVLYSFQPATKHTTRYTIGSKDYYLEDTGYVFKISDFGLSYSKSLEICNDTNKRPWKYYLNYKKGSFINVMEVDSFNICNSFYQYQKFQDLLIEEMLGVWYEMYFQDHLVLVPDIINKIFYSFEKKEKYKKWFNSNKSVK